jgi:hypothetical protein
MNHSLRQPLSARASSLPDAPTVAPLVLPRAVNPKYAALESPGKAHLHTCADQYDADKATNSNGGMKWIEAHGGYYSTCVKNLRSQDNAERDAN